MLRFILEAKIGINVVDVRVCTMAVQLHVCEKIIPRVIINTEPSKQEVL